ncbi:adenylosuccinate synthetase : Adenylosuccinate synthetase OS=Singulisphaera acidiphila (strain ATCC BAA-1392 / DSM 18658 / VKM B-2454 / MOB10) GN=purA PE=3 SV=1: Adenylsucc_synt [Gemmataceae bacterium]|nr:adenylosuccinate synthetase : Adenylosuccinate synthetase OS=Singulisphaera acidiphila (strain ATCC BAA-1392 / DSM 18658 / VKM B-2454 / MOB10) GN=purA PE=3 SV=1: Adenylsucc_synt [Gemmataceae bacterium]VTT97362.1 adenylosuccinate synthetase : Adenylosuccinate synthetase OS=Singulisphaera acidiphila (strain ATCC BAA-1392 / DSM 18658 / VKM B-2454 / MOB10) GN=purA PE=3 SV=1: Adenylsucc_synt [Gemmataceae bacterium]
MAGTCVVGLQWGDEAKGKIVDLIGDEFDMVVRYNGGANAGHTVVVEGKTFKLSLLPTGVIRPSVTSVIGNGVVVYPPRFLEEVDSLLKGGVDVSKRLVLSDHAHVIFPYHMEEERLAESGGGEGKIGTTGRGIGPCYQDKVGRRFAIRVGELLRPDHLRERLRQVVPFKNRLMTAFADGAAGAKVFDPAAIADEYLKYAERIRPYVTDTARLLHDSVKAGKRVLFEAAQGSLLDVDHGTYPFVTSSSSLPSGMWSGSGLPAKNVTRIIGVVKAYTTRVGRGPFPTELDDGIDGTGERIRKVGKEYGTVTGRPRRTGWFDALAVRYTAALAGADEITLMLLDVLSGLPELKLCVGYEVDGERRDHFTSDAHILERCKPVYETLPGWTEDITGARKLTDLPAAARKYIDRVSEMVGLPVSVVSVGPGREQTIRVR